MVTGYSFNEWGMVGAAHMQCNKYSPYIKTQCVLQLPSVPRIHEVPINVTYKLYIHICDRARENQA